MRLLRGKKRTTDIELPNESGKRDRRLPKPGPSPYEQLKAAPERWKKLMGTSKDLKKRSQSGRRR